ncbi:MAG: hypothetical protein HC902_12040 [Calothrix sp. SM1_5_4]|nr:hypothetical protein [Calothrix sp. SM1_5_4]
MTIAAPAAGTSARSGITLTGACADGLPINVTGGGVSSPATVTCASGQYSAPVVFSGGDGIKNVSVSQTDAAGNTGSVNRDFVRDNAAPEVRITGPRGGAASKGPIALQGTCETGIPVSITGDIKTSVEVACAAGGFSADVVLAGADGAKTVTASQTDGAGNIGSIAALSN